MSKKNVIVVTPSVVIARGFETLLSTVGDFRVQGIISDLSDGIDIVRNNLEIDVIVIDPQMFSYSDRNNIRTVLSETVDASVVAVSTTSMTEAEEKQYDEIIDLYDSSAVVMRKLHNAIEAYDEKPKMEGEELSAREKEILVCVAKGMLNKEIADYYNLSIYTVITHRKNITRKIGIKTVAGLTIYALLNNLIDPNAIE